MDNWLTFGYVSHRGKFLSAYGCCSALPYFSYTYSYITACVYVVVKASGRDCISYQGVLRQGCAKTKFTSHFREDKVMISHNCQFIDQSGHYEWVIDQV